MRSRTAARGERRGHADVVGKHHAAEPEAAVYDAAAQESLIQRGE